MNNPSESTNFELCLLAFIAETLACDNISDKVRKLRLNALKQLRSYLNHYKKIGLYGCASKCNSRKEGPDDTSNIF